MIQGDSNSKKEPLAQGSMPSKLIRVIAPTNLPGGYQLEVQTDNDPPVKFTATVPIEGVKAGDVFLTPPPPGYVSPVPQMDAPIGRWKDGLCDFFAHGFCHPSAWISILCTEFAMGQIMHRMRLTWLGALVDNHTRVNTFKTVLALVVCYHIYDGALGAYLYYNQIPNQQQQEPDIMIVSFFKDVGALLFAVWSIYALCKTRQHVRHTYSIPEKNCVGCEDCLCSTFCACCTVAQISRHTGDYDRHQGLCCTDSGLADSAPMVV